MMIKNIFTGFLIFFLLISSTMIPAIRTENKQQIYPLAEETIGVQWSRQYGAIGYPDDFNLVRTTDDGGYILVGDSQSYSLNHCIAAWLLKTNSEGHEEWNRSFGTFVSMGTECQQTSDGGYAFCGVDDYSCFMLVKTDDQGNDQWTKSYDEGTAWCFQETTDGGFILAGFPELFIRTDSQGEVIWKNTYLDYNTTAADSIEQTADGGFIVAGKTAYYCHGDHVNGFLMKLDCNGTKEWDVSFRKSENSIFCSVEQTPDNGFIVSGYINHSPWLVRIDRDGRELWNRTYDDLLEIGAEDLILTSDGGFAFVGNDGDRTSYIVKTDFNGTRVWQFRIDEYLTSLQQAADESIIVCGMNGNGYLMKIGHVPCVEITKPVKALYLFDHKILNFFTTIALGKITVEVNASDTKHDIERVEFMVDGVLTSTDPTAPYAWQWSTFSFFLHTLTVTAYNSVGNCSQAQIRILKIF